MLVIRIRESLNFGASAPHPSLLTYLFPFHTHTDAPLLSLSANTGQIKERLRRLELYGPNKVHPSEAPRREEATVVVIHMSDVESIDSSCVAAPPDSSRLILAQLTLICFVSSSLSAIAIFLEITEAYLVRGVHLFFTHLHPDQLALFRAAGIVGLLGESHFQDDVGGAIRVVEERGLGSGVVVA